MFEFISFILIFIEKSISFDYPYNIIAIPYLTYLIYMKGVESFWSMVLVAFLVSVNSVPFSAVLLVGTFYYVVFYILSTFLAYEKINIIFLTLIQAVTYSGFIYYEMKVFNPVVFMKLILAYTIFNYLYMDNGEKLFGFK